jgi:hypothetical protein
MVSFPDSSEWERGSTPVKKGDSSEIQVGTRQIKGLELGCMAMEWDRGWHPTYSSTQNNKSEFKISSSYLTLNKEKKKPKYSINQMVVLKYKHICITHK